MLHTLYRRGKRAGRACVARKCSSYPSSIVLAAFIRNKYGIIYIKQGVGSSWLHVGATLPYRARHACSNACTPTQPLSWRTVTQKQSKHTDFTNGRSWACLVWGALVCTGQEHGSGWREAPASQAKVVGQANCGPDHTNLWLPFLSNGSPSSIFYHSTDNFPGK